MNPSAVKVQCPFCLGHPRVKNDGTMYDHDRGRPGVRKRCPGAGKTKEAAKAMKVAGVTTAQPAQVRPEDIF